LNNGIINLLTFIFILFTLMLDRFDQNQ